MSFPETIRDVDHLEDLLSTPSPGAVAALSAVPGDILLLGVGGKMGPTLARMARRAADLAGGKRRIIGVSRFSSQGLEQRLHAHHVETIRCDLLDPEQLQRLPDVPNVLFMTGMKFGSTGNESMTWAMNAFLPGMVCSRFRHSRLVVFSTGNVYGMSPVVLGGSVETDALRPEGEYACSCVGRERIVEHFSWTANVPCALLRLNYAVEMRYGVLVDLGQRVLAGQPIDLSMGNFNAIWQADANDAALQAFAHLSVPPLIANLAGPELLSVRRVCAQFGNLFGKQVCFRGEESPNALLSNGGLGHRLFGYPRVGAYQMIHWIAKWLQHGGATLGKPTHFEVRDGKF